MLSADKLILLAWDVPSPFWTHQDERGPHQAMGTFPFGLYVPYGSLRKAVETKRMIRHSPAAGTKPFPRRPRIWKGRRDEEICHVQAHCWSPAHRGYGGMSR